MHRAERTCILPHVPKDLRDLCEEIQESLNQHHFRKDQTSYWDRQQILHLTTFPHSSSHPHKNQTPYTQKPNTIHTRVQLKFITYLRYKHFPEITNPSNMFLLGKDINPNNTALQSTTLCWAIYFSVAGKRASPSLIDSSGPQQHKTYVAKRKYWMNTLTCRSWERLILLFFLPVTHPTLPEGRWQIQPSSPHLSAKINPTLS